MRTRKTRWNERAVYRYAAKVETADGRYRTEFTVLKAGKDGVTAEMIQRLHYLDDAEVYNNLKNLCLSLDAAAWDDDGDKDKSWLAAETAVDDFADIPYEVERLREVVATALTNRQRQAYQLIGLDGYSITEAARLMDVSVNVAWKHYINAIRRIRENF